MSVPVDGLEGLIRCSANLLELLSIVSESIG